MSTGVPGSPIRRESWVTVISVGEGTAASTSEEDMDAMFQPRPHGAIAVGPCHESTSMRTQSQLLERRLPASTFLSWRTSLAASANSQSRKVTIFGRAAVAFGQMIQ